MNENEVDEDKQNDMLSTLEERNDSKQKACSYITNHDN